MIILGLASTVTYKWNLPPAVLYKLPNTTKVTDVFNEWDYPTQAMERLDYSGEIFYRIGSGPDTILFFGDSTIEQYAPRISYLVQNVKTNKTAVFATMGGLCPIPNVGRTKAEIVFTEKVLEFAKSTTVKKVIISGMWLGYLGGEATGYSYNASKLENLSNALFLNKAIMALELMIKDLISQGKEVTIILGIPYGDKFGPRSFFKRNLYGKWQFNMAHASRKQWGEANNKTKNILIQIAKNTKATVIDPEAYLCTSTICRVSDYQGIPIYKDEGHLRPEYVKQHLQFLDPIMN